QAAPCKVSSLFSSLTRQCPSPAHTPGSAQGRPGQLRGFLPEIQHVDKFLQDSAGIQTIGRKKPLSDVL
ncbi:hypothetical protein Nmel_009366, partial [Mimus melanotis]